MRLCAFGNVTHTPWLPSLQKGCNCGEAQAWQTRKTKTKKKYEKKYKKKTWKSIDGNKLLKSIS